MQKEKAGYSREAVLLLRRNAKGLGKSPNLDAIVRKFIDTDLQIEGVSITGCERRQVREGNIGVIFFTFSTGENMVLTAAELQQILDNPNHIPPPRFYANHLLPPQQKISYGSARAANASL